MLQYIRKFSGSWVTKGLLVLLIGSFAIWGITDFIRPRFKSENIAVVKKEVISRAEFYQAYRNAFNKLRGEFGEKVEKDPQIRIALAVQVLTNLIHDSLLRQEEKELDLVISEETLRDIIQGEEAFKDKKGLFSKEKYEDFLRSRGVTEELYLSFMRNDLKRALLMEGVSRSVGVPTLLMKPLQEQLQQTRNILFVPISAAAIAIPSIPSEEELVEFYSKNEKLFAIPEVRTLSAIILNPHLYQAEVKKANPDANDQELHQAMVEQIYEVEKEIQDRVASGETLAEVASQKGLPFETIQNITLNGQNLSGENLLGKGKNSLFTLDMVQKGYSLEEGGQSDLIEKQDGTYSIIEVNSITAESIPSFGEVKDKVIVLYKDQMRRILALDRAKEIIEKVRKGTPIEKVLQQYNLKGETIRNLTLLSPIKTISESLLFKLFSLPEGDIAAVPTKEGAQVGQVLKIVPQGIQKEDSRIKERMLGVQNEFENDISALFLKSLEQEFPVEVNEKAFQEMVGEP